MKIGVLSESFRLPMEAAILKAQELGLDGLQLYAVGQELNGGKVNTQKIANLKGLVKKSGLEISAICGDLGGYGFSVKAENFDKIQQSMRIVDLACALDTKVVTTHIGVIPSDHKSDSYAILQEACNQLAEYSNKRGVMFAVETGPEKAIVLKEFLDSLQTRGIAVNLDPANFVMVTNDDPVQAVYTLRDYIVHTHAKDGLCRKITNPKIIYDFFAQGGIGDLRLEEYFLETPLGEGKVDFDRYMDALKDIGYQGFLTIEREVGNNPISDIRHAINFLKKYL